MKKEKHLNPFVGLLIIILLYLFASTMENRNIEEDRQAQIDCMARDIDNDNNHITDYSNE
jgi:hypothetical protein